MERQIHCRSPTDRHVTSRGRALTDEIIADFTSTSDGNIAGYADEERSPALFHKIKDQRSVLALVIHDAKIFAGTQGGVITIWSLDTFELISDIAAHRGAVLALLIAEEGTLLISSGGDAIVNVWSTNTFSRLYSVYSTYDIGDIFSIAYSSPLQTIYLGAQNTSIQWCSIGQRRSRPPPDLDAHPWQRNHRFFDSKGPGGIPTPRSDYVGEYFHQGGQILEIGRDDIVQYAHYGYVYCMIITKDTFGAFVKDDEILISGGGDGSVKIWNIDLQNDGIDTANTLQNGDDSVLSMTLNGNFLYSGKVDGHVDVWDLEHLQLIQTIQAYDVDVLTVQVACGMMFTGGANGLIKILERYKATQEWKAHEGLILASAVTFHHQKAFLITGGNDDCITVWDVTSLLSTPPTSSRASNEQLVEALAKFVSFRSVSSKPEYTEDSRRCASFLRSIFKQSGATSEILTTDQTWSPVVYACFKGNQCSGKRLLFYGHYDVVPAEDKQGLWKSSPFALQGRNGYLYGRGVSDNKGPVLAALFAAADLASEKQLESDVVFLIEGEEESGSKGFQDAVRRNKDLIGCIDSIVLANSYWLTDSIPCLTYGLRGVIHANIRVENGLRDLHSGVSGSRLVHEPLKALTTLLARLSRPDGGVALPGFYDNVLAMTNAERKRYEAINESLQRKILDHPEIDLSPTALQAKWMEPSLTIHSFKTSGSNNATIIPHSASASISLRLVPDQDALDVQRALLSFLKTEFDSMKTSNSLLITTKNPADPWLGDPDNQIFQTLESAIIRVWGLGSAVAGTMRRGDASRATDFGQSNCLPLKEPEVGRAQTKSATTKGHSHNMSKEASIIATASFNETIGRTTPTAASTSHEHTTNANTRVEKPLYIREGGSIPAIRFLEKEFGAPAAQLPCGQASDNAHLDNERLRVLNLYNARKIFRRVFEQFPAQAASTEV